MPFLLSLPFLFLFLISCSDDVLYNEATPRIFVKILNNSDTVLTGKAVRFQAVMSVPPEDVEFYWMIENKNSTNYPVLHHSLVFERTFMESGLYNIKFSVKDYFSDTYRDSLFLRVSSSPVCNGLSIKIFQGSPTFKWNCVDADGNGSLTYRFYLFNKYDKYKILRTDTILAESSLQLGYTLQMSDSIYLSATNKYGIETHLDSVWGQP